jgi:hypothetical protein
LTVNGVGSSHRPVVDPEKVLTSWVCSLKSVRCWSEVCPLLVRRHSSGFHLHNFAFHPTPKLPLSQNAFTLYQSLWCGPTRPWRAASILLVITALRHHSTSTFRRGEIASPLSSHGLWGREESDVTRLNNVMFWWISLSYFFVYISKDPIHRLLSQFTQQLPSTSSSQFLHIFNPSDEHHGAPPIQQLQRFWRNVEREVLLQPVGTSGRHYRDCWSRFVLIS